MTQPILLTTLSSRRKGTTRMLTTSQQKVRSISGLLKKTLIAAGLLYSLTFTSLAAAVQCGDTIGPNVTVTLSGSLACDDTLPSLIIVGPAEVDMTALSIVCDDANQDQNVPPGVVLIGKGAKVRGGAIVGCSYGVYLSGKGNHTVEHMDVASNRLAGFYVQSSDNTLQENYAAGNETGFQTGEDTHHNKLRRNSAVSNQIGFYLPRGVKHKLDRNTASANLDSGFWIVGGEEHKLTENTAEHNRSGFDIDGVKHHLRRNVASFSDSDGFTIFGEEHHLTQNEARDNIGDGFNIQDNTANITLQRNVSSHSENGDGFKLSGQEHQLLHNEATRNWRDGIDIQPDATGIVLTRNNARDNNKASSMTIFDLTDWSFNCGTNMWKSNTFGTASQPCIQ